MANNNLVEIPGFGKQELRLYQIEEVKDIYIGKFNFEDKEYIGIIDKNGRILVPFSENKITNIFKTKDNLDYCFTIGINYKQASYHIIKNRNNYQLTATLSGKINEKCCLINTDVDNYWLVKCRNQIEESYAIYDVKKRCIITPFVTTIEFQNDNSSPIFAYLEKKVSDLIEGEIHTFTTLACYINKNGQFISPLLDMEDEVTYSTEKLNSDLGFENFNNCVMSILIHHRRQFDIKQNRIAETINDMRQDCLPRYAKKLPRQNGQIIPFTNTRGEKYDKK